MPFFDDIAENAVEYFDAVIDELGKDCRLVFHAGSEQCNNCLPDPIGKKSSNRYLHGGPAPFVNGQTCPLCGGEGTRAVVITESIRLKCEWDSKKFVPLPAPLDIRISNSVVETKGYMRDLPKVLRADHLLFQTDMDDVRKYKYRLMREPGDKHNVLQNRYFVAYWERT